MRLIGHLPHEPQARTFGDFLYVQGIENQLDHDPVAGWGIWIHDEDRIAEAANLLEAFRAQPTDPRFRSQASAAHDLRVEQEQAQQAYRKKLRSRRHLFRPLTGYKFGPLSFALIAVSVIVAIRSSFGGNLEPILGLFIVDPMADLPAGVSGLLATLKQGQVWRLCTPMFIHFGLLHIFFNMMWLADLGSMVEGRQGTWYLAVLVLAIAAVSNLAQYFLSGPMFGGMSGVVYGLLGYIWMRGKWDPASGLYLHPTTITTMIIWFAACFTPLLPNIANGAHAAGLVMGMAWGFLSSLRHR
jgi:GlpG protein